MHDIMSELLLLNVVVTYYWRLAARAPSALWTLPGARRRTALPTPERECCGGLLVTFP